jgi:glycosyltransferase involved in cell wall biosynthesis
LKENTVQDLAQAIERLIQSPGLREEMGRAGQGYARQFSYQAAARSHLELFEDLIAGKTFRSP